jgi:futalosine hydrolase
MNVLVVSATELEIKSFIQENNRADVLITGVGIPATVFNLTKQLFKKNYDLVIQAGIGGTFSADFEKGTAVIIEKDTFGDIGINENGNYKTLFDAGFINSDDFPFTGGWLVNHHEYIPNSHLHSATGITVNKITDDTIQIKKLSEKFRPGIESMEGAALHYVCLQQKINFLQLRSVSNAVGERDKQKWKMKEAIANLNIELKKLIEHFV